MIDGVGKHLFRAHSRNARGQGVHESMPHHVIPVCNRSVGSARSAGLETDARLASLLHDLGKYTERFAQRLDGTEKMGLDHSSAGARAVLEHYGWEGQAAALAIEGHHIGLQKAGRTLESYKAALDRNLMDDRSTGSDWNEMLRHLEADGIVRPHPDDFNSGIDWLLTKDPPHASEMLDVRMLFSTLVDADFIETEAHFDGDGNTPRRYRKAGPRFARKAALRRVLEAAAEQRRRAERSGTVTDKMIRLRSDLLAACLAASKREPGLFTLTAPTGAGKTLGMLAFAIAHARRWNLRRVVMVIPFLTIIEQTARICRSLFDCHNIHFVLEDHSAARIADISLDSESPLSRQRRLLAENWDAPIVVTTSLNALESLHANDPRRCRKLHHLAKSVLLFDEVQTLPPHLAELTLASLSQLSSRFGTSVVFSTATQPAFECLDERDGLSKWCRGGWKPTEIVPNVPKLFALAADRYHVEWRLGKPIGWDALAIELASQANDKPILVIVNLKHHAVCLVEAIQRIDSRLRVFHLSTNMCPKHRERMLAEAFPMLEAGRGCVFVATQCIEAGVDISAPVVYRSIAPLESIAQAAGRCNRHGTDPQRGKVVVFVPEDEAYPPGAYEKASQHTRSFLSMLKGEGIDVDQHNVLSDPVLLRRYYNMLYRSGIQLSERRKLLLRAVEERDFPEVSKLYRLIDQESINLLVPYDRPKFKALLRELKEKGKLTREWIAQARPLAVGIRRPQPDDDAWASLRALPDGSDAHDSDWFAPAEQAVSTIYDPGLFGLKELKINWFGEPL
jgi:CRISPR-associated endonuclease/helicase Cas3